MYQVSQLVVYGIHGVCRILQMDERIVDRQRVSYYVLEPLSQPGTRYLIPSQNPAAIAKMRPLLEREQLLALLREAPDKLAWEPDDNRRKLLCRQIIASADVAAMIDMLRFLQIHRQSRAQMGKRIHISDENFTRDAQRMLTGEICAVLGLSEKDALAYFDNI